MAVCINVYVCAHVLNTHPHVLFMLIGRRARERKALILPNDWNHVVKGKISLFDRGTERATEREEHEEIMSGRGQGSRR